MKRHRVLLFISEDWAFRSHRIPVAKAALAANFDVYLVTNVTGPVDDIHKMGIKILPFDVSRDSINPFKALVKLFKLCRLIHKVKPDLVHNVAMKPVVLGSLASSLVSRRIPKVNALIGLGYIFSSNDIKARVLRRIMRVVFKALLNRKRTATIIQNNDDFSMLDRDLGIKRTQLNLILGSGVDLEKYQYSPDPKGQASVAIVARLLRDKGVYELIAAMRKLKAKGLRIPLYLAGDIDERNPTSISRDQIRKWSQEGLLKWLGHVDCVKSLWNKVHICVLPSYREGLPKALLEAAACGRAIITTDTPGCREIVKHGYNGYLVPVRDSDKLAHYIEVLVKHKELRIKMGKAGRRLVESQFGEQMVMQKTIDLYQKVLHN